MSHRPVRTCVACGQRKEKGELLRITYREGELLWDERMRLGGRGVYLCPRRECIELLRKRRTRDHFLRSLRRSVSPEDVAALVEGLLARQDEWGRSA